MIDEKYKRFNNLHRNFCLTFLTTTIIKNYFFFEFDDSKLSFTTMILLRFAFCLIQQRFLFLCFDFRHDQHLFFREKNFFLHRSISENVMSRCVMFRFILLISRISIRSYYSNFCLLRMRSNMPVFLISLRSRC